MAVGYSVVPIGSREERSSDVAGCLLFVSVGFRISNHSGLWLHVVTVFEKLKTEDNTNSIVEASRRRPAHLIHDR